MVTKDQAMALRYGQELHYGPCMCHIGPRGGERIEQTRVRVSGRCQVWKTRPAEFRVPVKHGLYDNGAIDHRNAAEFHLAADCPLLIKPAVRVRCDQCAMLSINGVACHETGCPNSGSRWDEDSQTWVKQRKCFTCGYTVDRDEPCCEPMEDDQ